MRQTSNVMEYQNAEVILVLCQVPSQKVKYYTFCEHCQDTIQYTVTQIQIFFIIIV